MKHARMRSALGATLVTAGLAAVGAGAGLAATAGTASAAGTDQVYVCKWKKTPEGETEEIKPGKNPIVTSVEAVPGFDGTFPSYFGDAQTLSVVLGYSGDGYPVITLADCLANPPIDPEPTETVTTTAPTEPTETVTVTEPTETVTATEPTDDVTTTTTATGTATGTANPKPSDETETTDPEPTDGEPTEGEPTPVSNPKPGDETDPAPEPEGVPTAVDAGLGTPAPAVAEDGSRAAVALGGAGGLMTLAGGLLLAGARRRGDQEA